MLAFAKWQVVQDARRETIVKVQLRQTPIKLLITRQRVVKSAWIRTQAVRHAGVKGARPGIAEQGVQPVACALGFAFNLESSVAGCSHAVVRDDLLERRSVRIGWEAAADGVARDHTTCAGRTQILV